MLGECKTCRVLEDRIRYLEGLLDRTLAIIAPKPEEPVDPKLKVDDDALVIGEG